MQLSWWEIGLLEVGERVIVLEPIPVSDLIVPTNTSAVVDMNTLFEDGTIALMPDDLDLRAQLQERGLPEVFFVPTPFGDQPPPQASDVWSTLGLGPIGQENPSRSPQ
jgi:hypothetical protein